MASVEVRNDDGGSEQQTKEAIRNNVSFITFVVVCDV